MEKKMLIASLIVIAVFGFKSISDAAMCGEGHAGHMYSGYGQETEAVDVGNKICPVSGEKIDEKTKATYECQGKIYNFCCPMCIDEFKKNPDMYIEKVKEELQTGM